MSADKKYLNDVAKMVEGGLPDNHGFILMVVPFGNEGDNRLRYVSSLDRETAISVLKEWLLKCGAEEDWMKHIK